MTGDDDSIAFATLGSLLKVETNAPRRPSFGDVNQTISQGKSPLTANTAMIKPQRRNQRRAFSFIVRKTSALIMALSMLVIVSKTKSPPTTKIIDIIFIEKNYTAK